VYDCVEYSKSLSGPPGQYLKECQNMRNKHLKATADAKVARQGATGLAIIYRSP
jgi:hypothetical protein